MSISIRLLEEQDIRFVYSSTVATGGKRPPSIYKRYLSEQEKGKRVVLLTFYDNDFVGYVAIIWQSECTSFAEKGIPEINDLNMHSAFRRHGIATSLIDEAEKRIFEQSPVAGIGVGMYTDYGPA